MTSYVGPPLYAAFVWWFSTGAVLILVGLPARFDALRVVVAGGLTVAALYGLAMTAGDLSVSGAMLAFTSTILLWGAQEIAFLSGWLTGPRPQPCPPEAQGLRRLGYALAAILYHEFSLLACGLAALVLTWNEPNQIGLWTFASLWMLRQSSKINLYIGVPVTNDELMPRSVQFLKTYFARKSVGAFFSASVTLAIAVLAIMIQRIVEVAATPFEIVGLTLVATLFALGVIEHWFMLLPLPAITLWGWGMREQSLREGTMTLDLARDSVRDHIVRDQAVAPKEPRAADAKSCARQRLEDQFRQQFLEQHACKELASAGMSISSEPAVTGNGRTS